MKQYVVIAQDGRDEEAPERRRNIRPLHLKGAKELKAANKLIVGGAILDDNGEMKGSVMILQFENDEEFKQWYSNEPYITENVWKVIEVKNFKTADL